MSRKILNERGVALLIALLVTTLLIALVFEFAYGTRVSLRAAVNFRDGQRAFYLARSGVNFAGKLLSENAAATAYFGGGGWPASIVVQHIRP